MQLLVRNSNGTLVKPITSEQFAVVHDYITECMNDGRLIRDDVIRAKLSEAGMPMDFTTDAVVVPKGRKVSKSQQAERDAARARLLK